MNRFLRWLAWSVLFSLIPFGGILFILFLHLHAWPGLTPVWGTGQLMITSVAILGGGLKEMSGSGFGAFPAKDRLFLSSFGLTVVLAMAYGALAFDSIQSNQAHVQSTVFPDPVLNVVASMVLFGVSVAIAGAGVAISGPSKTPGGAQVAH